MKFLKIGKQVVNDLAREKHNEQHGDPLDGYKNERGGNLKSQGTDGVLYEFPAIKYYGEHKSGQNRYTKCKDKRLDLRPPPRTRFLQVVNRVQCTADPVDAGRGRP